MTGERPGTNASSVPADSPIVLFVNEALNPSTVNGALNVSQNGSIVPGTIALSGNNQVVQFTPAAPFTAGAYVQVFFSTAATDTFGNAFNNFQYSFTVAPELCWIHRRSSPRPCPTTAPETDYGPIPACRPMRPSTLQFSKPIDPTTVNSTNFVLAFCGNNGQTGHYHGDPAYANYRPDHTHRRPVPELHQPGLLLYSLDRRKDTNGIALVNTLSNYFYTGSGKDTAQPQLSSITPPNATTNIGTNAPIQVRFNKLINI